VRRKALSHPLKQRHELNQNHCGGREAENSTDRCVEFVLAIQLGWCVLDAHEQRVSGR
jgi:hypothetical protein